MFFETRLSRYLTDILCYFAAKAAVVQSSFSLVLLSLFIGFIFGNLFGTFLDTLRLYFFWNGLVGLILLVFIEIMNFLVYGISFSKTNNRELAFSKANNTIFSKFSDIEIQPNVLSPKNFDNSIKRNDKRSLFNKSLSYTEMINAFLGKGKKKPFFMFPLKKKWFYLVNYCWKLQLICLEKLTLFFENTIHLERALNSFKIGLLFGFFVDSFKVGS